MRYKFRGKRFDNEEWVVGFYHIVTKGSYLPQPENSAIISTYKVLENGEVILTGDYEVIPESVGQWTGLVDRHGKEIYEGDILHRDCHQDVFVEFYKGAFCLVSCNPVQRANWSPVTCRGSDIIYREIIGNIHDNPELMEV